MSVTDPHRRRLSTRTDRGAVAIIVALTMVALCIAGAFVLDLGLVRVDRQQNKSAADAAALAGANGLVPDVNSDVFHPFNGVCEALGYLKVNLPDLGSFATATWSDGNGSVTGDGCAPSMASLTCNAGALSPSSWARFVGTTSDGRFQVRIQSGYEVTDGAFPVESLPALQADPGAARYHGCDQLAVIITELRSTALGRLASAGLSSTIRSVGRVAVAPPDSPFALLILERTACDAVAVASGGALGRIDVLGYADHPGMIHVDSAGTGSMCSSKPVIEGKNPGTCPDPSPPLAPTCGGIVAHESQSGGYPGEITAFATTNVSDGAPRVYAGPYPGTNPSYRDQVTREIVDKIYLQGVTNAVNSEAKPAFVAAGNGVPPDSTWTATTCSPDAAALNASKVFVKCGNFNDNATFANATDLIFTGQIGSDQLSMPNAQHVYVVGGTSPAGISVGSLFAMHQGASTTCSTTSDATGNRARLFVLTGALKTSGGSTFRACGTTVVMMGGDTSACLPSLSPYVATYTNTPCPSSKAGTGTLDMSGNGTIDWTAPNLVDDLAQATADDHLKLEDLALWDETYAVQNVGGGGSMHLAGTFSAPNATPFKLNGGSTQDVKNSQYVVRQLWSTGNGTLTMQPLPALPVAPPKITFDLVR